MVSDEDMPRDRVNAQPKRSIELIWPVPLAAERMQNRASALRHLQTMTEKVTHNDAIIVRMKCYAVRMVPWLESGATRATGAKKFALGGEDSQTMIAAVGHNHLVGVGVAA